MTRARRTVVSLAAATLLLGVAGCSSSSSDGASSPTAPTASVPVGPTGSIPAPLPSGATGATGPNLLQWCGAYASLVDVLSTTGNDQASAQDALGSLDQFIALWRLSVPVKLLTTDEASANERAAAAYKAVVALVAGGAAADSPEVKAARAALQNQTDLDRELLKTSAAKILGTCGGRSASPSPTS